MRRSTSVVLAVLAAGCSDGSGHTFHTLPDPPPEVAWIAAIVLAGDQLVSSSGLVAASRPLVLDPIDEQSAVERSVVVLGWTAAQIDALDSPAEETLATSHLAASGPCEPRLPDPRWSAAVDGASPAALPALGAPWIMAPACPSIGGELLLDVRCRTFPCTPAITQTGCALELDLDHCQLGRLDAVVRPAGDLCQRQAAGCVLAEPRAPAVAALACTVDPVTEDCSVQIYRRPAAPAFSVQVVSLLEVPPHIPSDLASFDHLRPWLLVSGYTAGLTAIDGRLVVATHDGRFQPGDSCRAPAPSRLHFIDRATRSQVLTATAPPCLRMLLPLPGGRTFAGVFGEDGARTLGVFDAEGRLLTRKPLDLPPSEISIDALQAVSLEAGARLAFLWRSRHGPTPGALIVVLDAQTLEPIWSALRASVTATSMTEAADGSLAVYDDDNDLVVLFGRDGGEVGGFSMPHAKSLFPGTLASHGATRRLILAEPADQPVVHTIDLVGGYLGTARPIEGSPAPISIGPWPPDENRVVVGTGAYGVNTPQEAWIALFDPAEQRFLPGAVHLGFGITGRIEPDAGGVWVELPWEGSVAFVSPGAP